MKDQRELTAWLLLHQDTERKALESMQHPLTEQREASSAVHRSFDEFERGLLALDLSITPNQGQACQHSGFVSIDTADQQDVSATTEVDMSLSVWKEPIANLMAKAELVRIMVEYEDCSTRIREQVSYMSDYILKGVSVCTLTRH